MMPLEFDVFSGLNTSNSALLQQDTRQRIQKIFADAVPTNQLNPTLPQAPSTGQRSGNDLYAGLSQSDRSDLAIQRWLSDTAGTDKDLFSGAGTEKNATASGTDRFLGEKFGYNPGRQDNEDFYADQQKWYSEIPKAVFLKFPALVATKTGTGLGYLAGLINPENWNAGYIANAADNAFARFFENAESNIKNKWLTTFQEASDRDKGFFARAFTDLNFWTEDLVDGAAFMASAFVPGLTLSKLGAGAKAAGMLSRLGIASENGVLGTVGFENMSTYTNYMRKAQSIGNAIDKSLIVSLNTASEAMWEAKGVRDNVISSYSSKINPATGRNYTDSEARKIAGDAAMNTFLFNVAALSVSNLWETNLLYKALGKGESGALKLSANRLGKGYEAIKATTLADKILSSRAGRIGKNAITGLGVEGLYEENIQLAIQRNFEGTGKYKGGVLNQYLYQTLDAIRGEDSEAAMNIGLGAILGIMGGGFSANKEYNQHQKDAASLTAALEQGEKDFLSFGDFFRRDDQGTIEIDKKGKPVMDMAKVASVTSGWKEMANLKDLSDNTTNETLLKIYKNEQLARWTKAHLDAGKIDLLYSKLDDATRYTDKELIELGFDPASNTDRMQEITAMRAYVNSLQEFNDTLDSDILKSTSASSPLFATRKNHLYTLGSRQLSFQQQSEVLNQKIAGIRAKIDAVAGISPSDSLVDELNHLQDRIYQQKSLIQSLSGYDQDGAETNIIEEEKQLADLQQQEQTYKKANKTEIDLLSVNPDGRYLYQNDSKNKAILNSRYQNLMKDLAGLKNSVQSVNSEFYSIADPVNGEKHFKSQVDQKVEKVKNALQQAIAADKASKPETPTGKKIKLLMASNIKGGPEVEVEIEEGKNYLGQLLSKSVIAGTKGIKATLFNNDNIRIIKIDDNGNITLTVNGDAAVTFTTEEFRQIPAIRGFHTLSALQKFYINNRNKVFSYRIPVKFNKNTKNWETKVVNGRLGYNRKEDILEFVYLDKGKTKRIEFNRRFITGQFDLSALSTEENQGLQEQQKRLDRQKTAQIQLFEDLINDTESEIEKQKNRTKDIHKRTSELDARLSDLNNELDKFKQSFENSDKSKVTDKRSKAAKLSRLIEKTEAEISEIRSLLEELTQEKSDLAKRQAALQFYLDQYYTGLDEVLSNQTPLSRSEFDYHSSRLGELLYQESQNDTNNNTTAQIHGLLESTTAESQLINENISRLQKYEQLLTDQLQQLLSSKEILQLLIDHPDKDEFQTWLRHSIRQESDNEKIKTLRKLLNRISSSPNFYTDLQWLADSLVDTRNELGDLQERHKAVLSALSDAIRDFETRTEINQVADRINLLKDIFTGLTLQFKRNKASAFYQQQQNSGQTLATARTLDDAKRLHELGNLFSDILTDPPVDPLEDERLIFTDSAAPVMNVGNNPLFKTADSHFPGNELTDQEYTRRFFKFTSQVAITPDLFLMPVTSTNDGEFGQPIRYLKDTVKYPDDIKLVVFRKSGGIYYPVNIAGNMLSDATSEDIIYSSLYGHADLLSGNTDKMVAWARKNFVTGELTNEQIHDKLKEYIGFREWIKDQVKVHGKIFIPITGKSNGIQNREPKDLVTGRPQQLPVEGRIVDKSPAWQDVDLVVSTTDGQISGSTGVKIKPGRLAIRRNGNILQVYNRLLIDEEKQRIKRILKRLTQLIGKKAEYDNLKEKGLKLSSNEESAFSLQINQAKLLTQYLSTILYWRPPKDGVAVSAKQWYIEKGHLYKGDKSIPFTVAEIDKNLDTLLDGVYHQVASVLLNENYKNQEYQLLDIGNDGQLVIQSYNTYKEYLLTSENRSDDQIPVYTNLVSNEPGNTGLPQLKNSYLRFGMNSENSSYKPQQESKTERKAIDKNVKKLDPGEYKLVFENSKNTVSINIKLQKGSEFVIKEITPINGELTQTRKELMEFFVSAINNPNDFIFEEEDSKLISGVDVINSYLQKGSKILLIQEAPPANISLLTPEQVLPLPQNNPPAADQANPSTSTDSEKEIEKDAQSILDDLNLLNGSGFNVDYRIARISDPSVEKEDLDQVREWFSMNLPNISIKISDKIIDGKAWGAFKNGIIYLYEGAGQGTAYHEAFEAVYRSFLSDIEKQGLINEFKKRPDFSRNLEEIAELYPYHNEDQLIKEALAEEFREYVMSGAKDIRKGEGKRNGFFRQLWDTIKSFLGLSSQNLSKIETLFSRINSGYYSSEKIESSDYNSVEYRQISSVSQEILGYTMEGITSLFFSKLWENNYNTEALISRKLSAELVNKIWKGVGNQLRGTWTLTAMKVAAIQLGLLTQEKARQPEDTLVVIFKSMPTEDITRIQQRVSEFENQNIINRKDQISILNVFNTTVFENFVDFLKQFGFTLNKEEVETETDEELINSEEVENKEKLAADPLGIRDSLTIDTRNTASTTIKLLVASLTKDYYGLDGQIYTQKDPYMGLPRLVDYNATINTLFNDLNNIVSVYREGQPLSALDLMMEKLDQKYKDPVTGRYRDNVWISRLKKRIKYQDSFGERVSPDSLSLGDIRLLVAFTRTFLKNRNIPATLIIGEDGHIFDTDPIESNLRDRIVEKWANNAKSSYQEKKDFLILKNNEIIFNKNSETFQDLLNSSDPYKKLEFLKNIGISLSVPPNVIIQGKYAKKFSSSFESIRLHVKEGGVIENFEDLFSKQVINGPINTLISIETDYQSEATSLQYRNPEGETENSIIPPSCITNILNSLKGVTNQKDFILTNPQYGIVNPDGTVSLNIYQQNSLLLKAGGLIFDLAGRKKKDIPFHLISGITGLNEGDGIVTANLKQADKAIQDFYYQLKNWYQVVVNSDKSSEFALELGEFISMFTITSEGGLPSKVIDIYRDHLEDEVNTLVLLNNDIGSEIQYYSDNQYDSNTGHWQLSHFRDIITSPKNITALQETINGKLPIKEFINSLSIQSDIKNYLDKFIGDQQKTMMDLGIIVATKDGKYTSLGLPKESLNRLSTQGLDLNPASFSQVQFDNLAKYLFFNHQIAIREQHKLIYGHPAFYKDLPKRSSGATATKDGIVDDPMILSWMDKNMPRSDGKIRAFGSIQTFRHISLKDNNVVAEHYREIAENLYKSILQDTGDKALAEKKVGAKFDDNNNLVSLIYENGKFTGDIAAYINVNEADAQAYGFPDFYRDLLFLSGKFSQVQNDQWEYEMAYERITRASKPSLHPAYLAYTSDQHKVNQPEIDRKTLAKGNPHAIFPVLKPQYFGYQENNNILHTTFLKHSLQPKFYRMIENTAFEKIYIEGQRLQIDVLGYESGEKVGNVYNKATRSFKGLYLDDKPLTILDAPVQTLYTKYYGIQQETAASTKKSIVRGSQPTKLILSNLFKNGVAIKPEYNELNTQYQQTIQALTRIGKEELLKELGIEEQKDGSYVTTDFRKMVILLRDEALKRDMPANIIEAFEASLEDTATSLVYKFDSFSNREKIENILNALIDSRVIAPKMHGKLAVQASVSLYENLDKKRKILYLDENKIYQEAKSYDILTPQQRKTARIASSDLKFYKLEGGKIQAMEVYLPHWFSEYFGRDIDIKQLDKRLLKVIGYRIPTQGLNFIDNIIVKDFLKPEEGDTIIGPSELVGKSSIDYDFDKINALLPNYYVEEYGYNSERFKNFMIDDMQKRGLSEDNAQDIMKSFTVEDFIKINRATYTNEGKIKKGSKYSIEELTDPNHLQLVAFIKKSITNYNKTQISAIIYIEPGDDTKEALQNKLIQIYSHILELPENYRQLIMPSSSTTLKNLATEISDLKNEASDNVIPYTRLSEWNYLNQVREQFLVSKQLVGIGAVNVTSHIMSQISNIELNEEFNNKQITIRFPHNTVNGRITLSAITNVAGRWISDLLSEALSAFVDAAKDPFVFDLNINLQTAGTFFYLLRTGVPVDQIIYFLNQPSIIYYLNEQRLNETMVNKVNQDELSKNFIMAKAMSPFAQVAFPDVITDSSGNPVTLNTLIDKAINDAGQYDDLTGNYIYAEKIHFFTRLKALQTAIAERAAEIKTYQKNDLQDSIRQFYSNKDSAQINNLTVSQMEQQLIILSDFLDYQQQASALTDVMTGVSYDTFSTKNINENQIQRFNYQKALDTGLITAPENLIKNTFLKELKYQKEAISRMFQDSFVSLHPNSKASFQRIYELLNNPDLNIGSEKKKDILNRYQNFFLSYILQNIPAVNPITGKREKISDNKALFFGDNSFAHILTRLKKDPRYVNNKFIQQLYPLISTNRDKFTDNIKLFVNRQSSYEINELMNSIITLVEHRSEDKYLQEFITQLVSFAILQSGLQLSPITFTKVLPNMLYSRHVGDIFDKFTQGTSQQIQPDIVYKQFFQNNYSNQSLVPKISSRMAVDGILYVPVSYLNSNYDFLAVNRINVNPATGKEYSKEERENLIKNKRFDTLFTKDLYEKFAEDVGRSYYRKINKLGNRMYAMETYSSDTSTMTATQIRLSTINGYVDEKANTEKQTQIIDQTLNSGNRMEARWFSRKRYIDDNTCS